jgi:hypothetical protein
MRAFRPAWQDPVPARCPDFVLITTCPPDQVQGGLFRLDRFHFDALTGTRK